MERVRLETLGETLGEQRLDGVQKRVCGRLSKITAIGATASRSSDERRDVPLLPPAFASRVGHRPRPDHVKDISTRGVRGIWRRRGLLHVVAAPQLSHGVGGRIEAGSLCTRRGTGS